MPENTCCVTGHRSIPCRQADYVRARLKDEIRQAAAQGFTRFLSGYAEGVDQLFAELVLQAMSEYPQIRLEAAIPFRGRVERLQANPKTKPLLMAASKVTVVCEAYSPSCFHIRNHYMVSESVRVIAVHDGRQSGGTAATLRRAKAKGRDVREILMNSENPSET